MFVHVTEEHIPYALVTCHLVGVVRVAGGTLCHIGDAL